MARPIHGDSAWAKTLYIDRPQHTYSDITNLQSVGRVGPKVAFGSEAFAASENRRSMGIEIATAQGGKNHFAAL